MRVAALLAVCAGALAAQVVAEHDYDAVTDAVVSWRLAPGAAVGQSLTVPADGLVGGFAVKVQRQGTPGPLEYRLGRRPGGTELAAGRVEAAGVSPWFEHWKTVRLARAAKVRRGERVYLQLRLPRDAAGDWEIYGTATAPVVRPEFSARFRYLENWYARPRDEGVFENPANIDYGAHTPRYEGGAAFDAAGREIGALDFAFQVFGERPPARECEERFAFIEAITGPLDWRGLRRAGERPGAGEAEITADWAVESAARSEVVETAAAELHAFLAQGMGVTPRATGAGPKIVAAVGCGTPPRNAEGFEIEAGADGIRVCGDDERGAMRGLHYLEVGMRMRRGPFVAAGKVRRAPRWSPRITCTPFYSRMELDAAIDPYTEGLLSRIARAGFNGIWVWGDLDEVAHSEVYPELDRGVAARQARLRELAARAARWGIDVYVQLASRPLPEEFYRRHPEVRGSALEAYGGVNILCTSVEEVRRHLRAAARDLTARVPALKGIVFIVGGEGFMHCWTRRNTCPRCVRRAPQETIAEFSAALLEGARAGNPRAAVALWPYSASNTWSRDDTTQSRLIERLPAGMTLLTEFAKEGAISFGGITIPAYDYPLSIAGPSARFTAQAALTRGRGLGLWVKTEHAIALEFVDTPYIPAMSQWAERFRRIGEVENAAGVFANWMHYGFTPSRAADVFYGSMWDAPVDAAALLAQVARRDFGEAAAPHAVRAWQRFSEAIREYPFSGSMAMGVVQKGVSHPLFLDAAYRPVHGAGRQFKNDLEWTRPWGAPLTIRQFETMDRLWSAGVDELEQAVRTAGADRAEADAELRVARALAGAIRSTRNVARFYQLREELGGAGLKERARELLAQMIAVAEAELRNAREVLPCVCADSRLGYANSSRNDQTGVPRAGIYSAEAVRKKIAQLERMLREDMPAYQRARGLD